MLEQNFSTILNSIGVKPREVYKNLVSLFFEESEEVYEGRGHITRYSLYAWCEKNFRQFPYRHCTLTIDEFNNKMSFNHLRDIPYNDDAAADSLIVLCEYVLNFVITIRFPEEFNEKSKFTLSFIDELLSEMHLMETQDEDGVYIIMPANPVVEAVSSGLEKNIAIQLYKYTHHSMSGNLDGKGKILSSLAKYLEPRRKKLEKEAFNISDAFFCGANNFDIRHNNVFEGSSTYNYGFAILSDAEKEANFDRLFRLGLSLFSISESIDDANAINSFMKSKKKNR